ncbi:MAG: SDR family oxidoreductase [Caulobacter sp.]|nr:SDR family oxidoreductase [Caulobacter sp.]
MRIFLTGATGFIGSRIVAELLAGGHQVLGLTRSDSGAQVLAKAGAEPHLGDLEAPDTLRAGAAKADAVIHTAFDHDFSNFVANCQKDARVITAMGEALAGSLRPLIITSGVGLGLAEPGELAREHVVNLEHGNPRVASEAAGQALSNAGVNVQVVRLPQVHDVRRQGLVSPYIDVCRQKGRVAYVGEGLNRWSAAHVDDVARLYRLAAEQGRPGERFNAVAEEGVAVRDIAAAVGAGLGVPVTSLSPQEAAEHFGWLAMFAAMDLPASSAWTRSRLGWSPTGPGLLADLGAMDYAA